MFQIRRSLPLLAGAAALVCLPFAGAASAASLQKALTNTTGADNANPIQIKDQVPTSYEFTIDYLSEGGPGVVILDTIPAEFANVAVDDGGVCAELVVERAGRHGTRGATKIACSLPPETDASLVVTFETRQSPGRGHRLPAFAPTSCGLLVLNDGAVAVDPLAPEEISLVAGPTAMMAVEIDDLLGDACVDEDEEEELPEL